jgi:hypothetical protein
LMIALPPKLQDGNAYLPQRNLGEIDASTRLRGR